jgi:DNA helicase II / ATP-dependent DNA helicase PcrA
LIFTTRCSLDDSIDCVLSAINDLFEQGKGICLSTVHKAKGLESPNVYILHPELMPARYAVQEWQKEQERNVQYVAVTRSKHQLVYM